MFGLIQHLVKTYIYYSDYDTDQWVEIASTVAGFQELDEIVDVEVRGHLMETSFVIILLLANGKTMITQMS
jgi:hypothetical protein